MEQEASDGGSMASRPARQGFPVGLPSSLSRHASKEKNVKSVVYHLLLSDVPPHVRKSGLIKSNELVRHTVVLVMLLIEVRSDTLSIGADLRSWRVTQKSTWSSRAARHDLECFYRFAFPLHYVARMPPTNTASLTYPLIEMGKAVVVSVAKTIAILSCREGD
ncbi:hypothetical protein GW17_00027438 [Ensete ventricosum]|nr:hypothetical protein GW17_00027438 [Ensete ventricosum]